MTSPSSFPEVESYDRQWDPFEDDFPSEQQTQSQELGKLGFCQLRDWEEGRTYDETPAKYIRYSIHWSFKIHNRVQATNTETDLVLELTSYWRLYLKPKLDQVCLSKMRTKRRTIESEGTKVVLKVAQRSIDNFSRSCEKTDIDWPVIEKQLMLWADEYPDKKLTIEISFNYEYVETDQPPPTSSRRTDKRGRFSTTQQQLYQRETQLDAEEDATGQPSITSRVYKVFRCPGPPCNLGPHCWVDPVTKKHYKLKWHHFKDILKLVEEGHRLDTQNDMPEKVRIDLYAEEQQFLEKRQKDHKTSPSNVPPINIINTQPTPSCQTCYPGPSQATNESAMRSIDIPGFRDEAVEKYCAWHQSKVRELAQKQEYQKACDIMIGEYIDLELIYQEPDPEFLIAGGVKRGPALHIVRDISKWVGECKRIRTDDQLE
jgi:hypothetical protein